jgi:tetratricopeptide (TPR) repeat protein
MEFERYKDPPPWRVLRERSVRGERRRRRVAAGTATAVFLGGFLVALGLGTLVLVLVGVVLLVGGAAGALLLLRRHQPWERLRTPRAPAVPRLVPSVDRERLATHKDRAAATLARGWNDARREAAAAFSAGRRAVTTLRPVPAPAAAQPDRVERQREAVRLNSQGTQLRRSGDPGWAAEQHRAALTIFEELGDRRSVALTLNNLALAVAHDGDLEAAVGHFERALTILRELDDEEHEARVIANLGFAHRRFGHRETAADLLREALGKLSPASPDYRRVEDELGRAS